MKKYLALFSTLIFVACASTQTQGNNMQEIHSKNIIKNGEYKIVSIVNKQNGLQYSNTGDWSIIIENNRFGMFVGCNRIFGEIEQKNGKLILINPASTKMLCPDELMKVEDLVASSLTKLDISLNALENDKVKITIEELNK